MSALDKEWDQFVEDMDLMSHTPVIMAAARLAFYSGATAALEIAEDDETIPNVLAKDAEDGINRATDELVALTRKH